MLSSSNESRFWNPLLDALAGGRIVPIVGPEVLSIRQGGHEVPLYKHLATLLAAHLGVESVELPESGALNEVACRFLRENRGDIHDVYYGLKEVMPTDDALEIPEALVRLAEITPIKLFVSMTFDSFLERALNKVRFGGNAKTRVVAYSPKRVAELPSLDEASGPIVFQLLGKLSAPPGECAVTDEDTLEFIHALQSKTRRPQTLFDELEKNPWLIIGCSFPDWLARFFIRTATGERLSMSYASSFLADTIATRDKAFNQFLRHYSTKTRLYEKGTALDFINELHERWVARQVTTPKGTSVEPKRELPTMNAGAVFLSYASDDLEVVTALSEALDKIGIDVWFDKQRLKGGDDYEREIYRNIEKCSLFVPIVSRATLTADNRFFRKEWHHAVEEVQPMRPYDRPFILPIAIDDTAPTEPNLPQIFTKRHWFRLPNGRSTDDVLTTLREEYRKYQKAKGAAE